MRRRTEVLASVLLSLALAKTAGAQHIIGAQDDKRPCAPTACFRVFDRAILPAAYSVSIRTGRSGTARGYGMASLEHGIALSPRSVLDVGSISKQFTAMAMLILQQEGKLSLEDPIRKLFPEMPAYADTSPGVERSVRRAGYAISGPCGDRPAGPLPAIPSTRCTSSPARPNTMKFWRILRVGVNANRRGVHTGSGVALAQNSVGQLSSPTTCPNTRNP